MKPKNTLLLFIVAIGIFAFIHFYESKLPTTREAEESKKHVVNFDRDAIDGILITNNENKIELRKNGARWELAAPLKDRADAAAIAQLFTSLETIDADSAFAADGKGADKPHLSDYGLESSGVRLKLLGKNAPPEILFGKDAAVDGKIYLRLDGSETVYAVAKDLRNQVQKKTDDFRDRRLLDLDAARVNKLTIKTADGEIELLKDRGAWTLEKPLKARGDLQKINDLIGQTINTRIDTFVPLNDANLAAYGLSEPRGTVTLATDSDETASVLQIGQPVEQEKDKVYAKLSTRDSVYMLPKKIEELLAIRPNNVRDRHLLKVNMETVDRIHIEAAGKAEIILARKQEDWILKTSGDIAANADAVNRLAADLQNQPVTAFVADVAADLPKYGLDKPSLKITFSSYATDNTAESTAGETPFLTALFGKTEGDTVYAKLDSEPYIVSLPRNFLAAIHTDAAQWQSLNVYQFKPEEIASLEITREGKTVAVARSGSGWKLVKGDGVLNEVALQSLVNTLSDLHAVRWTGSATNGLGLENPSVVVAFTTAGKKTGKLTIGSANADSMWNAVAENHTGAFLVSQPDFNAFQAAVTTNATPSPMPVESASPGGVQ
jgi:hypothetical protein